MRTVLGTTAARLGRRGIALERLAQVTLRRDAYAAEPGPTVTLAIGERTTYRAGAWLLDTFERLQLGASYPPWGGTIGLALVAGQVRPVGFGVPGMVTHTRALPPDAWAAVTIAALGGPTAVVGVLLRASDDAAYRILATSAGATVVERIDAGTPTGLASVPTPWRAGDVLRVELAGPRLRVSRDQILVADVTDPGLPLPGRAAGFVAGRADPTDAAALTSFVGGELRQEYVGAGLDLGDVQTVLGQPVSFDVTLSNLAPLGGAARFAALLRHGQNTAGTYDLMRGDVRILTAVQGGTAPLTTGVGVLDGPTLTEDTARLTCRGRDAFLTPQLAPGPVTYVPGPPPGGLTPLPADPCAPSTPPVIVAGPVPPEPVDPAGPGEGVGPEAPDAGDGGDVGALPGAYVVTLSYRRGDTEGEPPEAEWVAETTVHGPLPDAYFVGDDGVCPDATPGMFFTRGTPSFPWTAEAGAFTGTYGGTFCAAHRPNLPPGVLEAGRVMVLLYFGPDVGATDLAASTACPEYPVPDVTSPRIVGWGQRLLPQAETPDILVTSAVGRLARFTGAGIRTVEDLAALRLATPDEGGSYQQHLPARIETLVEFTVSWASTFPFGGMTVGGTVPPGPLATGDTVPLSVLAGPCLIGMELIATSGFGIEDHVAAVWLDAEYNGGLTAEPSVGDAE